MALVAVPHTLLWPDFPQTVALGQVATLDAADEKAAVIFQAPKTGTIDRVGFRTATVTTGETVDVRLETVDGNGNPSGTLVGANTNGSQIILLTDDNIFFEVTLTAGASVTRGDWLAIVVVMPSVTTGNLQISRTNAARLRPYVAQFAAAAWSRSGFEAIGSIRYNDATYGNVPGLFPVGSSLATESFQSGTNPDERGNKITVPFPCEIVGAWFRSNSGTLGDFTLKLYDSGTTVLESIAVDGDISGSVNGVEDTILFDTEVTLAAGDVVRLTKLATTATTTGLVALVAPTGMAAALPGGGQMVYTTRNDSGGAWSDTADKVAGIGLIVSALSDGAGGSGTPFAYGFAA